MQDASTEIDEGLAMRKSLHSVTSAAFALDGVCVLLALSCLGPIKELSRSMNI